MRLRGFDGHRNSNSFRSNFRPTSPEFPRFTAFSQWRIDEKISDEGRKWNSKAAMVLARLRCRKAPWQRKIRQSLSSKRSQGSFSV